MVILEGGTDKTAGVTTGMPSTNWILNVLRWAVPNHNVDIWVRFSHICDCKYQFLSCVSRNQRIKDTSYVKRLYIYIFIYIIIQLLLFVTGPGDGLFCAKSVFKTIKMYYQSIVIQIQRLISVHGRTVITRSIFSKIFIINAHISPARPLCVVSLVSLWL